MASYSASPYIGQHSHGKSRVDQSSRPPLTPACLHADHSFFYTATQDFKLHLYSTQDAPRSRLAARGRADALPVRPRRSIYARGYAEDGPDDHSLRKIKTVQGVHGQWTVTDADLSRDNDWQVESGAKLSILEERHRLITRL